MSTRIILVRHGQSSFNAQNRIQGRIDESVLTELGESMAQQVAPALAGITFGAIYSSPLRRAKRTAEIIVTGLAQPGQPPVPALQTSDLLLEVDLPLWEGVSKEDVQQKYPEEYGAWKNRPHEMFMEVAGRGRHYPVLALFEQAKAFWQSVLAQHAGETILVVGHNGIIRSLLYTAAGVPPSQYQVIRQSNCSINVLNFSGNLGDPVQYESLNQTAHRGEVLPSRQKKTGCRILLVRHGETQWNRESRFQGQIDVPLNETGLAQAACVGEFLKDVAIDWAITSPMARPKQTAQAIVAHHPGLALAEDADLKEISHGLWEGKLEGEIAAEYGPELAAWKVAPETVQMPEGETMQQVWDRAVAAWQRAIAAAPEGSTGLVVAHDAVNKAILCQVLGLTPHDIWVVKQGNGAVTVVDYPQGVTGPPVLQALNVTSHLGGVLDRTAVGAL
jgi:phosphoserine phosphatase